MTQLTFFGPETAPFILSLAVHLTGIRLSDLHVCPEHFGQPVQAVSSSGVGPALVIWSGAALLPPHFALRRESVRTPHLDLQELGTTLAQRIEQARLVGAGPLAFTVTDVPPVH